MVKHKVFKAEDDEKFIKTRSFYELCSTLKTLKTSKGHFVLVLGTPGTGKSANIYQALSLLNLNVYDAFLFIDLDSKPKEVFNIFMETLKEDMKASSREDIYKKASKYDLVLFADPFLDSEYINHNKVGLGLWTEENGPSTFPFYFRVLFEFIKHFRDLKHVNVVAQTSWVLKYKGVRYDILTDFGFLSKILVFILKRIFDVVLISYSMEEIMEICRSHDKSFSDDDICRCIDEYGKRPRFIFEILEK